MKGHVRRYAMAVVGTVAVALGGSPFAVADDDPSSPAVDAVRTFVGDAGDGLFVGFDVMETVDADAGMSAYLCDGAEVSTWFHGPLDGRDVTFAGNGMRVEVTVAEDGVYGTVTLADGATRPFTAAPAREDGGLFHVDARGHASVDGGGWIVLPDGRQRGAVTGGGAVLANPALDTATLQAESPDLGVMGGCCCGPILPCQLACCSTQVFATPSPN